MEHQNFGPNVIYLVGILILYYIVLNIYIYIHTYIMYYKKRQQRIQEGQFLKSALNLVLILQNARSRRELSIPLKIIDLQNDLNIFVAKQWKIRISVPMSYINVGRRLKKYIVQYFFNRRPFWGGGGGGGVRNISSIF